MLSADVSDLDLSGVLRFPLAVSPKIDGVRCILWDGVAYSRNAKPIRNKFVQKWAAGHDNMDGELIVGSPVHDDTGEPLGRTYSGVMSFEGEPDFTFYVFDRVDKGVPFRNRLATVADAVYGYSVLDIVCGMPRTLVVSHRLVRNIDELLAAEDKYLRQGYEGIMMRDPLGPYKHGRSTVREGYLMKLKRFQDGEAVVVGIEEGTENTNALQRDELGRAKRSKAGAGLVPSGMVGTLLVEDPVWGALRVAPGTMPHSERQYYFRNPKRILGATIHWRSFGYGVKDKPRFPRYYGIREDLV